MALRVVAPRPDPGILALPWHRPLATWGGPQVLDVARGLSRHEVRIVAIDGLHGEVVLAVKETTEVLARREHRALRDLHRLGVPTVETYGVVTDRGEGLPAALVTRYLAYSLPYRSAVVDRVASQPVPALVDALVVLLVRLHLAGVYWGDVSLSNALFRTDAGGFAAFLVDAETVEIHPALSDGVREHDVRVGGENLFAELCDLQAAATLPVDVDPHAVVDLLAQRYAALWNELTSEQEVPVGELWRVEQRIARLNELGFDVEEVEVTAAADASTARIRPRVVEQGHHRRELRALTALEVEDAQARRLLNDLAAFIAHHDLGDVDRVTAARRWRREVYEPLTALVPQDLAGRLAPAEFFHEVLVHRWFLSEQAGHEVDIFETARDYVETVLTGPDR
ncbi:DUF4032 domain-containing protein [Nocardioides sp. R-C-SC26]|uniref:DUF4032 domain-containing protein n=1 Tax=Nocardioides sp. R-C-SC26 TaxID=2870414 RepID=UPI001E42E6B9|nr:DUF4032 domain-containing protein [Nocardioides sp. R-C-SC26]